MPNQSLSRYREMQSLRQAMDQFFSDSFMRPWEPLGEFNNAVDVRSDADAYVVPMNVPGFKPEDLHIEVVGANVTVRGEIKHEQQTERDDYLVQERHTGRFTRTVTLPAQVEAEKCEAGVEDGVLTLRVPPAEAARPKAIHVKTKDANTLPGQNAGTAPAHHQPEQEGSASPEPP